MPSNNQAGPIPSGYGLTSQLRKGLRYYFTERMFQATTGKSQGFAGGLNLRDAPTKLQANESPDMWNCTLDERGGVVKRLGYAKHNLTPAVSIFTDGFYSTLNTNFYWFSSSDGKLYLDTGNGSLSLVHTFSTGTRLSFADFNGYIYVTNATDGLYRTSDGITFSAVVFTGGTTPDNCNLCTVWQNKLWLAGSTNHPARVFFSAPGDGTKWDSTDGGGSNDLNEHDNNTITALYGGIGFDFQTKPGLFVFKTDSTYRITDSTTGSYVTVDGLVGTASKNSVCEAYGEIITLCRRGIYMTKKLAAFEPMSEQVKPLWDPVSLDDTTMASWAVGYKSDVVYMSMRRIGANQNDLSLRFSPLYGWITPGSDAMNFYVTSTGGQSEVLYGGSPSVTGQLYTIEKGGSDDGTNIQSWFTTHWYEPDSGHQMRLRRIRLLTRCSNMTVTLRTDFMYSGGNAQTVTQSNSGMTWGVGTWGTGLWGGVSNEGYADLYMYNVGRAFQVRIDETSSLTYSQPELLETGAAVTVGAWALYSADAEMVPLGLT